MKVKVSQSCPTPCDYMDSWNSPGQNTELGSISLLQGIFPTQGSNPGLPHHRWILYQLSRSSVTQSCPTLCNPMDYSTPGFPVHHQLLELTQTHVHWISYAIQSSHPLSSPSPNINISQQKGIFQWVSSLHQVAKVLEFQLQHQSSQWIFRTDFLLGQTGWICLQSKGLSRVFSYTTVQKHQFVSAQLSL